MTSEGNPDKLSVKVSSNKHWFVSSVAGVFSMVNTR